VFRYEIYIKWIAWEKEFGGKAFEPKEKI
jgi:hypothetical protein